MLKTEFDRERAILFDIETASAVDLRIVGARRYAVHPTTKILLFTFYADGIYHVCVPDTTTTGPIPSAPIRPDPAYGVASVQIHHANEIPQLMRDLMQDGTRTWVAHNAGFDAPIFSRLIGEPAGGFADSLPLARRAGLPGKLHEIGHRLLGVGKDSSKSVLHALCREPDKLHPPGKVALLARYCVADVAILARLWQTVYDVPYEVGVLRVDQEINERGIEFDVSLAARIVSIASEVTDRTVDEIQRITKGTIGLTQLRSPVFLREWFAQQGAALPNVRSETLENFLDDPAGSVTSLALRVMELKSSATKITAGKLTRALQSVGADNRLRDLFVDYGAHTGRWTSRTVQVHNLPRGHSKVDVEALLSEPLTYDRVVAEAARIEATASEVLSTLIRPTLVAPKGSSLGVADFSAIECRGVGWLAGCEAILEIFRKGACPYRTMASKIFGVPIDQVTKDQRQIGKVVVLGSGYGLSAAKFAAYAANFGIDLTVAGVTPDECIESFRLSFPEIVQLWKDFDRACKLAIETGKTTSAGRCYFAMSGGHLLAELPSGRTLIYRKARIEDRLPLWAKWVKDAEPIPSIVYTGHRGESILYGGKIAENLTQATCRDLLADRMVEYRGQGSIVLHVHDEIAIEVAEDQAREATIELAEHMSTPPAWAAGFPIEVKATFGRRYSKGCGDEFVARNGRYVP